MKQIRQIIHEAKTQLQPPPKVQIILILALALAICLFGDSIGN